MPSESRQPSLPDFAYLIQAAKESVQRGDLDEADVMLNEAKKQLCEHPQRLAATRSLQREIDQRRAGREEGIRQRLVALEASFGDGELMRADRLLFEATEDFGQDPRFDALRQHLKTLLLQDLESKIETMMEQATELSAERRDIEAMEVMHKAQAMAPPDRQGLQERLKYTTERLRLVTAKHRQERLEEAQRAVDQHLAAFDLAAARAAASAAETELVSPETVSALRRHLQLGISQRVHAEVQAASGACDALRFGLAVAHLRRALSIKPGDDWLQDRLQETAARQQAQERALQQDPAWTSTLASIQEAIVEQRFADARNELAQAEARWGQGASLDDLMQRLESACQEQLRTILQAARRSHQNGEYDTAQEQLAAARRIAPDDPSVRNLAETFERPRPEPAAAGTTPEVARVLGELEELRQRREHVQAWRHIQSAIETLGEHEPLLALQRRIAEEMVDGF